MFDKSIDERLSTWATFRSSMETCLDPLTQVWEFWKSAPFIPYNSKIDPFYEYGWPNPWEIIVDNQYDDFTKALMISWTLKLVNKFQDSLIEIKTCVDSTQTRQYNIVYVDEQWVINYSDNGPEPIEKVPNNFLVKNIIKVKRPR